MATIQNPPGDMLSLRVMRLNRPVLVRQQCEPAELLVDEIAGSLTASDASVRADLDGASFHRLLTFDEKETSQLPSSARDEPAPNRATSLSEQWSSQDLIRVKVGGPGELLGLPQSLGATYLGETFSAHVNLHNEGNQVCHNVELKISLHNRVEWISLPTTMGTLTGAAINTTPSSCAGSPNSAGSPATMGVSSSGQPTGGAVDLHPGQSLNAIIHHELKDLGTHTLRCATCYGLPHGQSAQPPSGGSCVGGPTLPGPNVASPWADSESGNLEPYTFQRLYQFNVEKPLDVKKKFHVVESGGCVFMEAQVQNLTSVPIYLERVVFEPSPHLTVVDLNGVNGAQQGIYGVRTSPTSCLRPEDIRQFLYRLVPSNPAASVNSSQASLKGNQPPGAGTTTQGQRPLTLSVTGQNLHQPPVSAGRLDITWRSTMGERGRLQTTSLKYEVPIYRDIYVKAKMLPSIVSLQSPFEVTFEVINKSTQHLDLQLDLRSLGSYQSDLPRKHLTSPGPLPPNPVPGTTEPPADSVADSDNKTAATEQLFPISSYLPALVWLGNTTRHLGVLSPGGSLPFNLTMMATLPGLQVISGLLIHELTLDRDYEFNELAQVLVFST